MVLIISIIYIVFQVTNPHLLLKLTKGKKAHTEERSDFGCLAKRKLLRLSDQKWPHIILGRFLIA